MRWGMGPGGVPLALALSVATATGTVSAQGYPRYPLQGFTVALPRGFTRVVVEHRPEDLVDTWRRGGTSQGPMVVQLVDLRAEIPQRALTGEERGALGRSDPAGFLFRDTPLRVRALGFTVDGVEGHADGVGGSVVRYAAVVPLAHTGLLVTVIAPDTQSADARSVFEAVLASLHGRTAWRTTEEQQRMRAGTLAGRVALGLSVLWGLATMAGLRAVQGVWVGRVRAVTLGVTAVAWWIAAMGLWSRPDRSLGAVGLALSLGLATGVSAVRPEGCSRPVQGGPHPVHAGRD